MSNSFEEKPLAPPKNPNLPKQNKKINFPFSQEIFALKKDEEGQERYQDPTVIGHIILVGIQLGLVILAYMSLTLAAHIKDNSCMKEFKEFNIDKTNQILTAQDKIQKQEARENTPSDISSSIIIND